jgi:hypothetical protein
MVNKNQHVDRLEAIYCALLIAVGCLTIVLPITAGIVQYYDGPCGSYTGPYPATAKDGMCIYEPIEK